MHLLCPHTREHFCEVLATKDSFTHVVPTGVKGACHFNVGDMKAVKIRHHENAVSKQSKRGNMTVIHRTFGQSEPRERERERRQGS